DHNAGNGKACERIALFQRQRKAAHHNECKKQHDDHAKDNAIFFCGDRKDEVRMAIWNDALDRTLARSLTKPATAQDCLTSGINLKRITLACHKAVNTACNVREDEIGRNTTNNAKPCQ